MFSSLGYFECRSCRSKFIARKNITINICSSCKNGKVPPKNWYSSTFRRHLLPPPTLPPEIEEIQTSSADKVSEKERISSPFRRHLPQPPTLFPEIEEIQTSSADEVSESVSKFLQGLKEMLLDGKHSDFVLNIKEKEFKVHKIILAARSPVFAAMFEHDMKEKDTNTADIEDCEPVIFSEFLNFLYAEEIENLNSDNVLDLYEVADKYQVTELKNLCMKYMMNHISIKNFCDILDLGLRHQEEKLIEVATQFFLQNSKKIALTGMWRKFLSENPIAGNELFLKVLDLKSDEGHMDFLM